MHRFPNDLIRASFLALLIGAVTPPIALAEDDGDDDPAQTAAATPLTGRYLLMDTNGRAVSHEDFRGRWQLLSFGYTFCPDICPTTLAQMAVVLNALGPDADRLQALFVTVDPERDTASVLRAYVAFFDPRIGGLTGSPALVGKAAESFRVRFEKVRQAGAAPDEYSVDHTTGMYLLGPDGRYLRKFTYGTPPAEIAARIRHYLKPPAR